MPRFNLGALESLAVASQLGFVLGAAVLIGILGGAWLDEHLGPSPLWLVVGSILGMASGIYSAAQIAKFLLGRAEKRNDKDSQGS
jgi:ATP synthase protein I